MVSESIPIAKADKLGMQKANGPATQPTSLCNTLRDKPNGSDRLSRQISTRLIDRYRDNAFGNDANTGKAFGSDTSTIQHASIPILGVNDRPTVQNTSSRHRKHLLPHRFGQHRSQTIQGKCTSSGRHFDLSEFTGSGIQLFRSLLPDPVDWHSTQGLAVWAAAEPHITLRVQ